MQKGCTRPREGTGFTWSGRLVARALDHNVDALTNAVI